MGSGSAIHFYIQKRAKAGVLEELWQLALTGTCQSLIAPIAMSDTQDDASAWIVHVHRFVTLQDLKCDAFQYKETCDNTISEGAEVQSNATGKWAADDGKTFHFIDKNGDLTSMIHLPSPTHVDENGRYSAVDKVDMDDGARAVRPTGTIYISKFTWTNNVDGHFDKAGKPVVDHAVLDFSGINAARVLNDELKNSLKLDLSPTKTK